MTLEDFCAEVLNATINPSEYHEEDWYVLCQIAVVFIDTGLSLLQHNYTEATLESGNIIQLTTSDYQCQTSYKSYSLLYQQVYLKI